MSKQALAVRYRPQSFEELTEQSAIVSILTTQVKEGANKNSYLFSGPAGCGKTTSARIFATMLNDGIKNMIELDAASNNGVDDIRKIIDEAKFQDLSSKFKIYIIDECFPSGTRVNTPNGYKQINEFKIGDEIETMDGTSKVSYVFNTSVFTNRLVCVKINNRNIITTKDHLFFTKEGWVKAVDLKEGDIIYDRKNLSILWKELYGQKEGSKVLLPRMFGESFNRKVCEMGAEELCNLWGTISSETSLQNSDLFEGMQEHFNFKVREEDNAIYITNGKFESCITKNELKQSNGESSGCRKNDTNKEKEWELECMERRERGQWEVYTTPTTFISRIRRWMDNGVPNKNKCAQEPTSISYLLQSRPCLSINENSSRGRWQRTSTEKEYIARFEKTNISRKHRVESVEVYQRGYNEKLFTDYFTTEELNSGKVTMYDLQTEPNHTYFVEDNLVHNCHMLSIGAWNALLKLLEEPPLKTIFILCTTDAQKIPKTILSRVQRYDFKKISYEGIFKRLITILEKEKQETADLEWDEEAIEYIARLAEGGMRDSITLLDKCISYSHNIDMDNVTKSLDVANMDIMLQLTAKLLNRHLNDVIEISEYIYQEGNDIKIFTKQYLTFILNLIKYLASNNKKVTNLPNSIINSIDNSTINFDKNNLLRLMDILIKLNADIKWETNPKTLFQATLIDYITK